MKLQAVIKGDRASIPLHHLQAFRTQSGLLTNATRRRKIANELLAKPADLERAVQWTKWLSFATRCVEISPEGVSYVRVFAHGNQR